MKRKLPSIYNLSALALSLCAALFTSSASAEDYELIDAKVVDIQYAGGQQMLLRWETYNWDENTYFDSRGTSLGVVNGVSIYRRYSLFARELGGEYLLVKDLGSTRDRTWSGQVSALNSNTALQFQVREQNVDTGAYSQGLQAPGRVIELTNIDLPPSFDHQGDQLELEFYPDSGVVNVFEVDNWASNYSDGDDGTQEIFVERVYALEKGIQGYLFPHTPDQLWGGYATTETPVDGLVVFQACDVSRYSPQGWMGACGEEIPVILRSKAQAVHANFPSFTMSNSLSVGDDYSMQEIPDWATNLTAGDNATNPFLLFHTIWVTNSELFEIGPWISLPSRTLRFKFKEGASGTSKMYVALADWSEYSPENISAGVSTRDIYTLDISPDHSSIQTIEFNVGSNTQVKSTSNGSRGADMQSMPAPDAELVADNGGGGAAGLALLSLGLLAFSRRK